MSSGMTRTWQGAGVEGRINGMSHNRSGVYLSPGGKMKIVAFDK